MTFCMLYSLLVISPFLFVFFSDFICSINIPSWFIFILALFFSCFISELLPFIYCVFSFSPFFVPRLFFTPPSPFLVHYPFASYYERYFIERKWENKDTGDTKTNNKRNNKEKEKRKYVYVYISQQPALSYPLKEQQERRHSRGRSEGPERRPR